MEFKHKGMSAKSNCSTNSNFSESGDDTYCVFLHIAEGIGFNTNDIVGDHKELNTPHVLLKASLNGVQFEMDGNCTPLETKFNSNCIWESKLNDIKRIKYDNRPIKLECYSKCQRSGLLVCDKLIGTLLLPIKYIPLSTKIIYGPPKLKWHKLGTLSAEWRSSKPEINLLLMIVKKTVIEKGQMELYLRTHKTVSPKTSATVEMLHSQQNIYIRLLEQDGLIQVGNIVGMDCELFRLTIIFKHFRNIEALISPKQQEKQNHGNHFVFNYDLLGQISNVDIPINGVNDDCYVVNEKISVNFKSSFKHLREYFKKVFYIPVYIYCNGLLMALKSFDFGKLLPLQDSYFDNETQLWSTTGELHFDKAAKEMEEKLLKLSLDYVISLEYLSERNKKCKSPSIRSVIEEHLEFDRISEEQLSQISEPRAIPSSANSSYTENAVKTVATNTDPSDFIDYDDLSFKVVQELEQWKSQQMQKFLQQLERKEEHFKQCFQENCLSVLTRLESKIPISDQLNSQLESMMKEFNETTTKNHEHIKIFDSMRIKMESAYEKKFIEIGAQMDLLKMEILEKEKSIDIDHNQSMEVKGENEHLKKQIGELKEQIRVLQQNLTVSQTTNVPIKQLINIISDMGKQSERLSAALKSNTFYQEQWTDVSHEINKIRFELIKIQEKKFKEKNFRTNDLNLFLEDLINDEQESLASERIELRSIRDALLNSLERDVKEGTQ